MEQVFSLVAAFIQHNLGIEVPVILIACAIYLVGNDLLDALIEEKKDKGHSTAAQLFNAIMGDVVQKNVIAAAVIGAVGAYTAGGDFHAQLVTALVGVAIANAANLEQSTKQKLATLLAP